MRLRPKPEALRERGLMQIVCKREGCGTTYEGAGPGYCSQGCEDWDTAQPVTQAGQESHIEKELVAMGKCVEGLETLDKDAQQRVLEWVCSRYKFRPHSCY